MVAIEVHGVLDGVGEGIVGRECSAHVACTRGDDGARNIAPLVVEVETGVGTDLRADLEVLDRLDLHVCTTVDHVVVVDAGIGLEGFTSAMALSPLTCCVAR